MTSAHRQLKIFTSYAERLKIETRRSDDTKRFFKNSIKKHQYCRGILCDGAEDSLFGLSTVVICLNDAPDLACIMLGSSLQGIFRDNWNTKELVKGT